MRSALLHDHLDGGLRVGTVLELADATGYRGLPSHDPSQLAAWFDQRGAGTLEEYLVAFDHTVALMQTTDAIERISYEAVIDLAGDGVGYAELRYAPTHSTREGLRREDALEAMIAGLRRGTAETGTAAYAIAVALRHQTDSLAVARAASRFAGEGVVGFDLAGLEDGYPASEHLPAIRHARDRGLGITIHAGEGLGARSIADALGPGGAMRIGHGVRIIEDCTVAGGSITEMGLLARRVLDLQVPLELCITSNVDTGAVASYEDHPFGLLHRAGFNVTINTDNRLMSNVSMSSETHLARSTLGLTQDDIDEITRRALRHGFGDFAARRVILDG